jgi:hypothetical protein
MGHYGSKTPKRQIAWSNSKKVGMLNQGKLSWATRTGRDYERHKTAVTRVSRSGKKQFQGRKPQLKASQCLACGGIYTFFGKLLMGMDMRICFK